MSNVFHVTSRALLLFRSLSTWVAVGDTDDTTNSQLPSPHVELIKVQPRVYLEVLYSEKLCNMLKDKYAHIQENTR